MAIIRTARIATGAVAGAAALLVVFAPAATAETAQGGCQVFGQNVARLAGSLGGDFGATASSAARSGPRAFPENVVHPEQEALCP